MFWICNQLRHHSANSPNRGVGVVRIKRWVQAGAAVNQFPRTGTGPVGARLLWAVVAPRDLWQDETDNPD